MTGTNEVLVQATVPYGRAKGYLTKSILRNVDGTRFYCAGDEEGPCPNAYEADSFGSVMAHRSGRHGKVKANRAQAHADAVVIASLKRRAQSLLDDLDKIQINGDDPRLEAAEKRAATAERKLAALKRALA